MTLLRMEHITIGFGQGVPAVRDVSLSIAQGEMLALVGESGSGKSLTALSVLQLLPESARMQGSIRFEGNELAGAPEAVLRKLRGNRIGMVFQEPMTALNPLHTLGRQLSEALEIHAAPDISRAALKARVAELLEQVGLAHFTDRLDAFPHQLSGGERQRVLIAMAIANNPSLLIADEPTTAVDVTVQAKILALLKRLQQERKMAMLFITHDLTLVRRMADRVAVMRHGEIVEQGKVADVFAAPQHDYTRMLLASEPKGKPLPVQAQAETVMECERLSVSFPIRRGVLRRKIGEVAAVKEADVRIRAGETLGIVGESGSGKTTLALALLRLLPATGRIVFLGQPIDGMGLKDARPLRNRMQLVFQDPYSSLNPRMSVQALIEEGLRVHEPGLSEAERIARVSEVLTQVSLSPEMRERYPHEFSGGQRQRISIARAMVLKPRFVILDEPTSALDLTIQAQIVELLKAFQRDTGMAYAFISHDLRVVRAVAHRIIVMRKGQIVEQAETEALFAQPREEYTQQLLKAAYLEAH